MLVFHSEQSLLWWASACKGAHFPLFNWNWHHCVFNHFYLFLYNHKSVYVCKVMHLPSLKTVCSPFLFVMKIRHSPPQQFQTPTEMQHGLLHCTVSLLTVRLLLIDRISPPTESHFGSPATQSVHRDNNYEAWQLGMRLAVSVYVTEVDLYLDFYTVCARSRGVDTHVHKHTYFYIKHTRRLHRHYVKAQTKQVNKTQWPDLSSLFPNTLFLTAHGWILTLRCIDFICTLDWTLLQPFRI